MVEGGRGMVEDSRGMVEDSRGMVEDSRGMVEDATENHTKACLTENLPIRLNSSEFCSLWFVKLGLVAPKKGVLTGCFVDLSALSAILMFSVPFALIYPIFQRF